MILKIENFADRIIWLIYLALAVITPLLFSTRNSELFEVPKMLFVYLAAVIVITLLHVKFIAQKKHSYPANIIFISLLILLATQIASTFTSIDKFTSIYGFPSRLNGGLLSLFAYLIIFVGVFNLTREKIQTLLQAAVISALAISLWGIPAHFGYDPTCWILNEKSDIPYPSPLKMLLSTENRQSLKLPLPTCWQKEFDPTLRIFSTLGQPNWLASYLVLIIPISMAQIFISKRQGARNFFIASTVIILIALIFTNSRAGVAGFVTSLFVFVLLLGKRNLNKFKHVLIPLFAVSAIVGIIFGASLVSRTKEALGQTSAVGTESGAIRLIVWRGAMDVFKNYPFFGTGPETFAYSYYKIRPPEHNQTTEWNFFYNKAHNEFLNYLANTGILGFAAYMFFLAATFFSTRGVGKLKPRGLDDQETMILAKAVLASLVGYQVTIFFGFSTVTTQLLMFLLIGSSLVLGKKENLKYLNLKFLNEKTQLVAIAFVIIFGAIGLTYVARIYAADIFIDKARNSGYGEKSYNVATKLFPTTNPFYLADSAYAKVLSLRREITQEESDKGNGVALDLARSALETSPNNLLVMRKVVNTYLLIAESDEKYNQLALDTGQKMLELAPNDPPTFLTFAKIQSRVGQDEDAKKTLETALKLKPDYLEAQDLLDQLNSH